MILFTEFLVLLGSLCFVIASLGLFRMPGAFAKLHAGTKAASLGIILMLAAAILRFPQPFDIFLAVLTMLLIFVTAPLASHAIAIRLIDRK